MRSPKARSELSYRLKVIVQDGDDPEPGHSIGKPWNRSQCRDAPRPCPWVSCRHHLMIEVNDAGSISYPYGDDIDDLPESCSLDVADRGEQTQDYVGEMLGISKQRVQQVEETGATAMRFGMSHLRPEAD